MPLNLCMRYISFEKPGILKLQWTQQSSGRFRPHQPGHASHSERWSLSDQPLAKSEPGGSCQQQWVLHATHGENFNVWLFVVWMRMCWKDQTHLWHRLVLSVVRLCCSVNGSSACETHTSSIDCSYLALLRHTDMCKQKQKASLLF